MTPATVIRLTAAGLVVNHRLPSGPAVMPAGPPATGNDVAIPAGVMRPIPKVLVNQRLPSGPAVMSLGAMNDEGSRNSWIGCGRLSTIPPSGFASPPGLVAA